MMMQMTWGKLHQETWSVYAQAYNDIVVAKSRAMQGLQAAGWPRMSASPLTRLCLSNSQKSSPTSPDYTPLPSDCSFTLLISFSTADNASRISISTSRKTTALCSALCSTISR